MLLLLTNGIDGTADILVELCAARGVPVFRFNIDLWAQYRFAWTADGFVFRDPTGRSAESGAIDAVLWRRPSLHETPEWEGGSPEDRAATEAELQTIVREIADWARARGRLRLIDPAGSRRVGRLAQMRVGRRMVKRLTAEPVGAEHDRYIYVQSVESDRLAPEWPWLLQEIAEGDRDATVLYVHGRCFGFEMAHTRAELGVEDWRIRNVAHDDPWSPIASTPTCAASVCASAGSTSSPAGRNWCFSRSIRTASSVGSTIPRAGPCTPPCWTPCSTPPRRSTAAP